MKMCIIACQYRADMHLKNILIICDVEQITISQPVLTARFFYEMFVPQNTISHKRLWDFQVPILQGIAY